MHYLESKKHLEASVSRLQGCLSGNPPGSPNNDLREFPCTPCRERGRVTLVKQAQSVLITKSYSPGERTQDFSQIYFSVMTFPVLLFSVYWLNSQASSFHNGKVTAAVPAFTSTSYADQRKSVFSTSALKEQQIFSLISPLKLSLMFYCNKLGPTPIWKQSFCLRECHALSLLVWASGSQARVGELLSR